MGIWVDILKLAASGQSKQARELLSVDLPKSLRRFVNREAGGRSYTGPVAQAVSRFVNCLPGDEKEIAKLYELEIIDEIVCDVVAGVEKSLILLELSVANPEATLHDIVQLFPWGPGLKRSSEWKREWVADMLRSMIAVDIRLPAGAISSLGSEGQAKYQFNEIAYALGAKRLQQTWDDLKKELQLYADMVSIDALDLETGVSAEGSDFGRFRLRKQILGAFSDAPDETAIEWRLVGETAALDLASLVEQMHSQNQHDGYRPIAWHRVFWDAYFKFDALQMNLEYREPQCKTDQSLSDHIAVNCPDVVSSSRPTITKRREKLESACEDRIIGQVLAHLERRAEQKIPDITHVR